MVLSLSTEDAGVANKANSWCSPCLPDVEREEWGMGGGVLDAHLDDLCHCYLDCCDDHR